MTQSTQHDEVTVDRAQHSSNLLRFRLSLQEKTIAQLGLENQVFSC